VANSSTAFEASSGVAASKGTPSMPAIGVGYPFLPVKPRPAVKTLVVFGRSCPLLLADGVDQRLVGSERHHGGAPYRAYSARLAAPPSEVKYL
jgi:hypothetical protein